MRNRFARTLSSKASHKWSVFSDKNFNHYSSENQFIKSCFANKIAVQCHYNEWSYAWVANHWFHCRPKTDTAGTRLHSCHTRGHWSWVVSTDTDGAKSSLVSHRQSLRNSLDDIPRLFLVCDTHWLSSLDHWIQKSLLSSASLEVRALLSTFQTTLR